MWFYKVQFPGSRTNNSSAFNLCDFKNPDKIEILRHFSLFLSFVFGSIYSLYFTIYEK